MNEFLIILDFENDTLWQDVTPWRRFLQQFRSQCQVWLLGIRKHTQHCRILSSRDGESIRYFLPPLEETELRAYRLIVDYTPKSELAADLAALQPLFSTLRVSKQVAQPWSTRRWSPSYHGVFLSFVVVKIDKSRHFTSVAVNDR